MHVSFLEVGALLALGIFGVSLHLSFVRHQEAGRPGLSLAVLILSAAAPLALWAAGTRRPISDYSKIPLGTHMQGVVGPLTQVMVLGLAWSTGVYLALRRHEPKEEDERRLWLAYLAFAAGPVIAMAAGSHRGFRYPILFAPATVAIAYTCINQGASFWTAVIRRLLMVYVWASLLLALVDSSEAFDQQARASLLLGHAHRLVGVTATPNSLGPLAAMALLFVAATSEGRWRVLNGTAAGVALAMTDSRMAIAGAVTGLLIIFVWRDAPGRFARMALVGLAVGLPIAALLAAASPLGTLSHLSGGSLSEQNVSTVSGREAVWTATIQQWKLNRWFGYGPTLWSPEYRAQYGPRFVWVGQAHNQWLESLGQAGLVGLAGLLIYVAALVRAAFRFAARSHGLVPALVILLLFRMMSESALRTPGLDLVSFMHLCTFVTLIAFSSSRPAGATDTKAETLNTAALSGLSEGDAQQVAQLTSGA